MLSEGDDTTFDPICGNRVDPRSAHALEYRRHRYVFCSKECKERFERQIERHRVHDLARLGTLFSHQKAHWGLA